MRRKTVSAAPFVALALLGFSLAACYTDLPEEGTEVAALYRERCGSCHGPYQPSSLTIATWKMIFPRMEERIAQTRGVPNLSPREKEKILAYLERHALNGS